MQWAHPLEHKEDVRIVAEQEETQASGQEDSQIRLVDHTEMGQR